MPSENALLDLLSYQFSYPEPGIVVVTCLGLPNLSIRVQEAEKHGVIECLRNKAKRRIEEGEIPQFFGNRRDLLVLSRVRKKDGASFLWIHDSWCGFNNEQLAEEAMRAARDWIQQVGPRFYVKNKLSRHSISSLTQFICRKVKQGRKQYLKDKEKWELKVANAQQANAMKKASDAAIRAMIDWLVTEAQRYMVSGGRLRELRNVKPPGKTPAETWHLRDFDQFNLRAKPQQIHTDETKDAKGNVIKSRTWCENAGGGEIAAVVEQAKFMLEGIAHRAEKGSEEAMTWLYRLAMFLTQEFWVVVEAQPDLACRMSASWQQVPIHWNDSPSAIKQIKSKAKRLQLPKLPSVSLKVQPDSPHQQAVCRTLDALNYLMRSPFVSMPPTPDGKRCNMLDDSFPCWLRKAIKFVDEKQNAPHDYGEILWEVYTAAMTAKPDSPWKKQSRPRKAKEKFMQAFMARIAKTP
jgi:hypothetical protein